MLSKLCDQCFGDQSSVSKICFLIPIFQNDMPLYHDTCAYYKTGCNPFYGSFCYHFPRICWSNLYSAESQWFTRYV